MQPGDVVDGRFELERLAGKGGMGEVYRALDRTTGRPAAVKLLAGDDDAHAARLLREASLLAELDDPAVVCYLAHGETPVPYLAMEWLDGEDLAHRLRRQPLDPDETIVLARRIARALGVAHARGIVHRDVKPSNLFLVGGRVEDVKILDFGIARAARASRFATATGLVIGTLGYMAPEQAAGESAVDARADVYALGCVLFECLTGRRAFEGEHVMALLAKICCADVPRVRELAPGLPAALDDLVARLLAKAPDDRPPTGAAVAVELERLGPIDLVASTAQASPSTALTEHERRLVAFVLAEPPRIDALAATAAVAPASSADPTTRPTGSNRDTGVRVQRLADGSLLAVFRASTAATDLAANAARYALALQRSQPGTRIAVAMGASANEVGPVLDRAARLVRAASASLAIRIDDVTAGLLDARFEVDGDALGLVVRAEREMQGARHLLGRPTPCVGRERELSTLEWSIRECFDEPRATALLVTAPPGFGKTRLRHELLRGLRANDRHVEVWHASGDPMSAGSPFGLLSQLVRAQCGLAAGDPDGVQRDKLHARIARHVDARELERVFEFIGELAGVSTAEPSAQVRAARADPRLMGDQMLRAWEDFVAAECAREPLAIVLDDLHWGDLPTVRFIDTALRAQSDRPLLVLALARPEVHELFPGLWAGRLQEIRLAELTRSACERLVREVLGPELASATLASLVDRAGGNAFYLEELIRAQASGSDHALPETVVAMAQSRLERLDADARRLLRAGSVYGQSFWPGAVAALIDEAKRERVGAKLDELVAAELIGRRPTSRFRGEPELAFRHAFVRDAAYAMLVDEDRELGHRLAGGWLEAHGEQDPNVLAEHFMRGGEAARAVSWFGRAARQAFEGNDFAAALSRAERGIAAGAAGHELGELLLVQAESHGWRGHNRDEADAAQRAMSLLEGDSPAYPRAAMELALASSRLHERERLRVAAEALRALDPPAPIRTTHLHPMSRTLIQLLISDEYEIASALVARIVELEPQISDEPTAWASVQIARSMHAVFDGNPEPYLRNGEAIVLAFEAGGDRRYATSIGIQLTVAGSLAGAYAFSVRWGRYAFERATDLGLAATAVRAKATLVLPLARSGDPEQALRLAGEAAEEAAAQRDIVSELEARVGRARIELALGDYEAAERDARACLARPQGPPMFAAIADAVVARACAATGRGEQALAHARGAHTHTAHSHTLVSGLLALAEIEALVALGDRAGASAAIAAAAARLRQLTAPITDPEIRRSMLEDVPENARVLVLERSVASP